MNYKSFTELSEDIKKNLYKVQDVDYDLVVGIPRSGMIPAYMLSLYLNKNCIDIVSLINNTPLKNGITRTTKSNIYFPYEAKKILLVDDSIYSGNSLKYELLKIPAEIKEKLTTLAIYSSREQRDDIDIFFEYIPMPRVFEWNIFHHSILSKACVDIDGVLCQDPNEMENDDGKNYTNFLKNAAPLFLPTGKIHSLVTSRLEKYRDLTVEWLNKHNIQYDNLIMLDLPSMEERRKLGIHAKHKADYYEQSDTLLFIESNSNQAREIWERTNKSVYCVENNYMYNNLGLSNIIRNYSNPFMKYIPQKVKNTIKQFAYRKKTWLNFW